MIENIDLFIISLFVLLNFASNLFIISKLYELRQMVKKSEG